MIWKYQSAEIAWFEFVKIKGVKIILHVKLPTSRAARLKVLQYLSRAKLLCESFKATV